MIQGSGSMIQAFRVEALGLRVQDLGFRLLGLACRV